MAASTHDPNDDESDRLSNTMVPVDIFHDDNVIDEDDDIRACVADGFRPAAASPRLSLQREPIRPAASPPPTSPGPRRLSTDLNRRSSIRKSMSGMPNPFASADDADADADEHGGTANQFAPYPSIRPLSSASSNVYAQSHVMHIDSSGPAHHYAMYPQGTDLERTSSSNAASGTRPFGRSQASSRPSHPYAMYPQNVQEEDLDDDDYSESPSTRRDVVPVGFPESMRHLRRDPDNISLFTNSEQLPPYSEYPENAAPKPNDENVAADVDQPEPQAPAEAHVPFLINIPPQSMSDSRRSTSDPPRSTDRLLDGEPPTAHAWKEKSWKQKRRTKFYGIPFGWLLLGLGTVAIIAIVVGGTVGGLVDRGKARRAQWQGHIAAADDRGGSSNSSDWIGSGPSDFSDAEPMPHSSAAPLPTGEFDLNLGPAQEVQNDCLPDSQAPAWDCDLFDAETLMIQVNNITRGQGAFIYPKMSSGLGFGTQAPSTVLSMITLVKDRDSPEAGDAYQFQVLYNKLVILSQSAFNASSVGYHDKRESHVLERRDLLAGERPWFCYWNNTMLEGFIYLDHEKSEPPAPPPSSTAPAGAVTCKPSGAADEAPDSTHTACPSPEQDRANKENDNVYSGNIKIEERRIAGSPSPYCTQMQILDNGIASPVVDPESGKIISISLQENDPSVEAYNAAGASMHRRRVKRGLVAGSCHCQWLSL